VTQENIDKIAKLPVDEQYQFCMSYVDAWHQMMNTIGHDSSSKSQSLNQSQASGRSHHLDTEKNPNYSSSQTLVKKIAVSSSAAVGVITEVGSTK
jgi:hypothetical protein